MFLTSVVGCKINLGLHVVRKRPDGYHDIETVFYPIDNFKDKITIAPSEQAVAFRCEGMVVPALPENNLCVKAFRLLERDYGISGVEILLEKHIPMGAGLGGGSADAAYTLKLLKDFFQLPIKQEQLRHYALQLGSDVPFFLENKPVYATGRGELMTSISLDLSPYRIEVVHPDVFVSTDEAYQGVTPRQPKHSIVALLSQPVSTWRHLLVNDFEERVFAKHPQLAAAKENLYAQGALYAAMSGSGSALFGIFKK